MVLKMLTALDTFWQKKYWKALKLQELRPLDTGQGAKNKKFKPATQNSKLSTGTCFEVRRTRCQMQRSD